MLTNFLIQISQKDNPAYAPIVKSLPNIRTVKSTHSSNYTFTLASLLPANHDNYFSYVGSLTTPPCTEGVRWIDFKHPIQLSHTQVRILLHTYKSRTEQFCSGIQKIQINCHSNRFAP